MVKQLKLTVLVEHAAVNGEGGYDVCYLNFCYQRRNGQQSGGNGTGAKGYLVSRCQAGLTLVLPVLSYDAGLGAAIINIPGNSSFC